MFHKDFHKLNDIYLARVLTESVGLGPQADGGPEEGLSPMKQTKIDLGLPTKKCVKCDCGCGGECGHEEEDCEECESMGNEMGLEHESEENADMARQSLFRLVKLSAMLHDLIQHNEHIEPWVLAKITEAQKSIESVYGYQDYETYKQKVEADLHNIEEETEKDLYKTIDAGGSTILSNLRKYLATESKEALEVILVETITALEKKK